MANGLEIAVSIIPSRYLYNIMKNPKDPKWKLNGIDCKEYLC